MSDFRISIEDNSGINLDNNISKTSVITSFFIASQYVLVSGIQLMIEPLLLMEAACLLPGWRFGSLGGSLLVAASGSFLLSAAASLGSPLLMTPSASYVSVLANHLQPWGCPPEPLDYARTTRASLQAALIIASCFLLILTLSGIIVWIYKNISRATIASVLLVYSVEEMLRTLETINQDSIFLLGLVTTSFVFLLQRIEVKWPKVWKHFRWTTSRPFQSIPVLCSLPIIVLIVGVFRVDKQTFPVPSISSSHPNDTGLLFTTWLDLFESPRISWDTTWAVIASTASQALFTVCLLHAIKGEPVAPSAVRKVLCLEAVLSVITCLFKLPLQMTVTPYSLALPKITASSGGGAIKVSIWIFFILLVASFAAMLSTLLLKVPIDFYAVWTILIQATIFSQGLALTDFSCHRQRLVVTTSFFFSLVVARVASSSSRDLLTVSPVGLAVMIFLSSPTFLTAITSSLLEAVYKYLLDPL